MTNTILQIGWLKGGNGTVKNWEFRNLYMDFSSMYEGNDHPSDIDMVYIGRDQFLIIGEIKNERGFLSYGQRKLLESFINGWRTDGMALYITHNKYVQHGDNTVDVSECFVQEIYYRELGKWVKPRNPTKVADIIEYYRNKKEENK